MFSQDQKTRSRSILSGDASGDAPDRARCDFSIPRSLVRVSALGKDGLSKGVCSGERKCRTRLPTWSKSLQIRSAPAAGDAHVHFFRPPTPFSFGEGVTLQDGDEMIVEFACFGVRCATRSALSRAAKR